MRKLLRALSIVITFSVTLFILVFIVARLILSIPYVQNALKPYVVNAVSKKLKTKITLKYIDLDFPNKLELDSLIIYDRKNNILLSTKRVYLNTFDIHLWDLIVNPSHSPNIYLSYVRIEEPFLNLYRSQDSLFNFKFLFTKSNKKNKPLNLNIEYFSIINGTFSIIDSTAGIESLKPVAKRINYKNIVAENLNLEAQLLLKESQLLDLNLLHLNFNEKNSGFGIEKLSARLIASVSKPDTNFSLQDALLITEEDTLSFSVDFPNETLKTIFQKTGNKDFLGYVNKSVVSTGTINYFLKKDLPISGKVSLFGDISGNKYKLRSSFVNIRFKETDLTGKFSLNNYTTRNIFINTKIDEGSKVRLRDLTEFLPNVKFPNFFTSDTIYNISGKFTGFPKDFVVKAEMKDNKELLKTNINLKILPQPYKLYYKGTVITQNLNIDKIIHKNLSKSWTSNIYIEGKGVSTKNLEIYNTNVLVINSYYKTYKLDSLHLKGFYKNKQTDSHLFIKSDFLTSNLSLKSESKDSNNIYYFTGNIIDLYLNSFFYLPEDYHFSSLLAGNFKGDSLENLRLALATFNTKLKRNKHTLHLISTQLLVNENAGIRNLTFSVNPLGKVQLKGKYTYKFLLNSAPKIVDIIKFQYGFIDSLPKKHLNLPEGYYTLTISTENTTQIKEFYDNKYFIAPGSSLRFFYEKDNIESNISFGFTSKELLVNKIRAINPNFYMTLTADTLIQLFAQESSMDSLFITTNKLLTFSDVSNSLEGERENMTFLASLKHDTSLSGIKLQGSIILTPEKFFVSLLKKQSSINLFNTDWNLTSDVNIKYFKNKDSLFINNFSLFKDTTKIKFFWSLTPPYYYSINFINVPLNNFAFLLPKTKYEDLNGLINMELALPRRQKVFVFTVRGNINEIYYKKTYYGNLNVKSYFSEVTKRVNLFMELKLSKHRKLNISGYYDLKNKNSPLFFTINTNRIPAKWLEPVFKNVAQDITGEITIDKLFLRGKFSKPILKGKFDISDIAFTTTLFKVRYNLQGKIELDNNIIILPEINLSDKNKRTLQLNGSISHNFFTEFLLDVSYYTIDNDVIIMNTTKEDNEMFYGFLTLQEAKGSIYGTLNNLSIEGFIAPGENSLLNIPVDYYEKSERPSYIHFISDKKEVADFAVKTNIEGLNLLFEIDANPGAELRIIFDEKLGDMIKARGTGDLIFSMDPLGEIKLFGEYYISEGSYNFTLKNFFSKQFIIDPNSYLKWRGDPYNAKINIIATYHTLASLQAFDSTATQPIPVNVKLYMTGYLQSPHISFGIDFPNLSYAQASTIISQLQNIQNDEQELNKQAFSLLVFGAFAPFQGFSSSYASTGMATNVSEFLTNQFNQLLGKEFQEQVQVSLKTSRWNTVSLSLYARLFGNRVIIERQGAASSSNNQQVSLGNISIRIRLLPLKSGTSTNTELALIIFNRENWALGSTMTSVARGGGIFFKRDFDSLAELFNVKRKSN